MDELLTTDEAAAYLRTPPSTLAYWRSKRVGPLHVRVGRRVLYTRSALEQFVKAAVA